LPWAVSRVRGQLERDVLLVQESRESPGFFEIETQGRIGKNYGVT
jgi:hypothetical protein